MKHNIIKIIFILLTASLNITCFAQLGYSEKQIIETQGKYKFRLINDEFISLMYDPNSITEYEKPLNAAANYHIDRKTGKCYLIIYNTLNSASENYYKTLNSIAVKINENRWKNYNDNSIFDLKDDGPLLNVEHYYDTSKFPITTNKMNPSILSLQSELNKCKNENQLLLTRIEALKKHNQTLIDTSKELTILTNEGANNIEKALASLKEKDLKITKMQDALRKKDSLMFEYIKELNNQIKKQ